MYSLNLSFKKSIIVIIYIYIYIYIKPKLLKLSQFSTSALLKIKNKKSIFNPKISVKQFCNISLHPIVV